MKYKPVMFLMFLYINVLLGQHPNPRTGVFLHHSTGNRIWGPNASSTSIPLEIEKYNNSLNLSGDSSFVIDQKSWPLVPWDNEWYRWHTIFNGEDSSAIIEPLLESYQCIIIKSCYPSSDILDRGSPSDTLNYKRKSIYNYKWHWRNFVKKMEVRPDNFFAIWTNTPRIPSKTNDSKAILSDEFSRWAVDTLAMGLDPIYGPFPLNVYIFDFFHKLAGPNGKMLLEYAAAIDDNHPNAAATQFIAPQFVEEIIGACLDYETTVNISPPILYSPLDDEEEITLTPLLDWNDVASAGNYNCQLSEHNNFNNILISVDSILQSHYLIPKDLLRENTRYFWRVYSNNAQILSGCSQIWNFKTKLATDISNFGMPTRFELMQNHPNPFNPTTEINYSLPEKSGVKIQIFNSLGQVINTIVDMEQNSGYYKTKWDAKDFTSGVYIYKIIATGKSGINYSNSKKMLLLK